MRRHPGGGDNRPALQMQPLLPRPGAGRTVADMGMTEEATTHVEIDGHEFILPGPQHLADLMSRIETAARTEPTFVDVATRSGIVSVLITPHSRVFVRLRVAEDSGRPAPDGLSFFDWDY